METLLKISNRTFVVVYILVDVLCVGAGMTVPIFCILLGFPLGWYLTKRLSSQEGRSTAQYSEILRQGFCAAGFTCMIMIGIWGTAASLFLRSGQEIGKFGHPFIFFDPKASFIGWLGLMILVSPFLQLLTTIFSSFVTLLMDQRRVPAGA